jgi:nucleoside-diphosphate-sugar epimerase
METDFSLKSINVQSVRQSKNVFIGGRNLTLLDLGNCRKRKAGPLLVADVMVWAAQSPQAANEAFNITNGDVFERRNVWPAMAETLGVKTRPDTPTSLAAYLAENADVWNKIVTKYDLRSALLVGVDLEVGRHLRRIGDVADGAGRASPAAAKGASIFKMMDVSRHKSVDTLRGYDAGAGLL